MGSTSGYYWFSEGNVDIYGTGSTSYYNFRGGRGIVGVLYSMPYYCETGKSMNYIFRTPEVEQIIGDCQIGFIDQAFMASIPFVKAAIDAAPRDYIPLVCRGKSSKSNG